MQPVLRSYRVETRSSTFEVRMGRAKVDGRPVVDIEDPVTGTIHRIASYAGTSSEDFDDAVFDDLLREAIKEVETMSGKVVCVTSLPNAPSP